MRRQLITLLLVAVVFALSLAALLVYRLDLPSPAGGRILRDGLKLGLDLKGGTHLVLEADFSRIGPGEQPEDAMAGVVDVIQRRINAFGVAEPIIQRQPGGNRVIVQLPGVRDVNEAVRLIGQTAQLEFKELAPENQAGNSLVWQENGEPRSVPLDQVPSPLMRELTQAQQINWLPAQGQLDGVDTSLTGRYLKRNSFVGLDPQTNEPQVHFEWNGEGATLFEQITTRIVKRPLGIFLDQELISAPTVQDIIKDRGIITGITLDTGRLLAIQLNAGALPIPLQVVQRQDVDAFLGADSLAKSVVAGVVGLALVGLFMLLYYRYLGFIAVLALLYYGVLVLAIFKLIPVTLTLAGIAGFIISLGMAVDANVLIFERMREELRRGASLRSATEQGFSRAWNAIRDSNVTTLIVCAIVYWFGSKAVAPPIMGFALTLGIGITVSMFTALTVTHSVLRLSYALPLVRRLAPSGV